MPDALTITKSEPLPDLHIVGSAPLDTQKSFGGFLSNVVSSGRQQIADMAHAVTDLPGTLAAVGSIPLGIYEKLGGPLPAAQPGEHDAAKTLDAMVDHFKQRYGSLDAVKESLYKDPVGVAADLSAVLGGGGVIADAAKLGKAGEVLSAAGRATNPLRAITTPIKAGVMAGAKAAGFEPAELYRTALKPRIDTPAEDVRQMVSTGLKNEIPVNEGGAGKLDQLIKDLQANIDAKTQAAAAAGINVDPASVASRVDDVESRLGNKYSQVNPAADRNAIQRAKTEFLNEHTTPGTPAAQPSPTGIIGPNGQPIMTPGQPAVAAQSIPIPADKAQQMKVGTYQKIRSDYGAMSTAQVETQKALARGLKEELAAGIPELTEPLGKQGNLLDLQPVLENAVNKAANRPGGFRNMISAAAAGSLAGQPVVGAGYGVIKTLLEDPSVRSRLAIIINQAQQKNPGKWGVPSMANAIARVDAYAAGQ